MFGGNFHINIGMEIKIKSGTLKQTCINPQILEGTSLNYIPIYVRFNGVTLNVRNKNTNELLCSGDPIEFRGKSQIPTDKIEFFIEMYSNFKITFV